MSSGFKGPMEQIRSQFEFSSQLEKEMLEMQCERLKMTPDEFYSKIVHDWWLYGKNSLQWNVADEEVYAICDPELSSMRFTKTVHTIFGSFDLVYSGCPLAWDPLDINVRHATNAVELNKYIKEHWAEYFPSSKINEMFTHDSQSY